MDGRRPCRRRMPRVAQQPEAAAEGAVAAQRRTAWVLLPEGCIEATAVGGRHQERSGFAVNGASAATARDRQAPLHAVPVCGAAWAKWAAPHPHLCSVARNCDIAFLPSSQRASGAHAGEGVSRGALEGLQELYAPVWRLKEDYVANHRAAWVRRDGVDNGRHARY